MDGATRTADVEEAEVEPGGTPGDLDRLRRELTPTEEVIFRRRSVRVFKKRQVPEWMIRRVLEAGRFAPSAANFQPWKFVVVRDRHMLDEMTEFVVEYCKKVQKVAGYTQPGRQWLKHRVANLLVRRMPNSLHPTPFGAINMIAEGRLGLFHGAPTVIFIFKDVRGVGSPDLDCGIAGQNMVLTAHSMGLGTCWVGFGTILFDNGTEWRRRLGLEYPYEFASSIAVGLPKGEPDGMVPRETHPVVWFEDGTSRPLDPCDEPQAIHRSERARIPDYRELLHREQGVSEL